MAHIFRFEVNALPVLLLQFGHCLSSWKKVIKVHVGSVLF